jgi:hypothetical protein
MLNLPVPSHNNSSHTDSLRTQLISIEGLESFFEEESFPEKGLTVEQACLHYRQPLKKLKRLIKSGQIEAIKLGLTDTVDDWRIFPNGIPQDFGAATRVSSGTAIRKRHIEPKKVTEKKSNKSQQRKENKLAIEGEIASLRADVTNLEQRLTSALDHISLINYEMDIMKQVVSQIGVSTNWLNDRLMEVHVDRDTLDKLAGTTIITVSGADIAIDAEAKKTADVTTDVEAKEDQIPGKEVTWLGSVYRWIKGKVK